VSKLIRRILTGTIVLTGMGAIVLSSTDAAKAFVLEDDFESTADTAPSWFLGNSSAPSLLSVKAPKAPKAPEEGDPNYDIEKAKYDIEKAKYDIEKAKYDWYKANGLYNGWGYAKEIVGEPQENPDNNIINSFWLTSFAAGATFEPNVTISTWFISPIVTLENGAAISFDTKQFQPGIANRLEVRYNLTGSCRSQDQDPAECAPRDADGLLTLADAETVGDFTYQFLKDDGTPLVINPDLEPNGYFNEWTRFTGRINGLTQPTSGRLAFRYFVTEAGYYETNSSAIGIDNIRYQTPVPTPALLPGLLAIAYKNHRKRKHQAIA
jgi:hypothetical protein